MKIIDKRANEQTYFKDLSIGDVFIFDNRLYMKIPEVRRISIFNSVTLSDGYLAAFTEYNNVELIDNCELILKR